MYIKIALCIYLGLFFKGGAKFSQSGVYRGDGKTFPRFQTLGGRPVHKYAYMLHTCEGSSAVEGVPLPDAAAGAPVFLFLPTDE